MQIHFRCLSRSISSFATTAPTSSPRSRRVTSVRIMAGDRNCPRRAGAGDKYYSGGGAPARLAGTASPAGFLRRISGQRVACLTQQEAAGGQRGQENEFPGLLPHGKTNPIFCAAILHGR